MQAEWSIKNLARKFAKFRGQSGRLKSLIHCFLNLEKWTLNYPKNIKDEQYQVYFDLNNTSLVSQFQNIQNV